MSRIHLKDLGVLRGEALFAGLNLTIGPGDRLGLVAANGRGKSTLLRVLAGEEAPGLGEITRSRGLRVGHLAQEIPAGVLGLSVAAVLAAEVAESWRAEIVLDDLAFPPELRGVALRGLSGGWQRMAMLARAWVSEPDMLLMDEPTNHLDLARTGWLQGWLAGLPRDFPVVVASHDRAFLDAVTNRTLFLRGDRGAVYTLPYSRAKVALAEGDLAEGRRFANDMAKVAQLRKQAAKLKNIGINSGSDLLITKTKQLSERAGKLAAQARAAHVEGSAGAIRLEGAGSHARALIRLQDAAIARPDGGLLFRTGVKWISPGERVVVLGRNGQGKSRLVGAVFDACRGAAGDIRAAASMVCGYSDQGLTQLEGFLSPAQAVAGFDLGDHASRVALAGVGVKVGMQGGAIAALSGGQRARLAMLILRLQKPNFHLLDEPTNHLDIEGQEALEAELLAHEAGCLLVSHDRAFVRAVANRFWLIEGKRLVEIDDPEPFFHAELTRQG